MASGDGAGEMVPLAELVGEARRKAEVGAYDEAYDLLWSLADDALDAGFADVCLELLQDLRDVLAGRELTPRQAAWVSNLDGLAKLRLGDLLGGQRSLQGMQAAGEAIGDAQVVSTALQDLGIHADLVGDYDAARRLFARSAQQELELGDYLAAVQNFANLASADISAGDLDAAETHLDLVESLVGKRRGADLRLGMLVCRGNLAAARHDYAEAESYYRRALAAARRRGDVRAEELLCRNIGNTILDRVRSAPAARWYARALEAAELLRLPPDILPVLGGLAVALHRMGRDAEARHYLERARILARDAQDEHAWATATADLGALELHSGDAAAGERLVKEALPVFLAAKDSGWASRAAISLLSGCAGAWPPDDVTALVDQTMAALADDAHADRYQLLRGAGEALLAHTPPDARAVRYLTSSLDYASASMGPAESA